MENKLEILTEEMLIKKGFTKGTVFTKENCRISLRNYGTDKKPSWGVFIDNFMNTETECQYLYQFEELINNYNNSHL